MKWITHVVAIILLTSNCSPAGQQDRPIFRNLAFDVRILQSKAGSREPVLVWQQGVVTSEGRLGSHISGGELPLPNSGSYLPFGLVIECHPGKIKDGKVPVEFTLKRSYIAGRNDDAVQVRGSSTQLIGTVALGTPTRLAWHQDGAEAPMWADLIVFETKPPEPPKKAAAPMEGITSRFSR